MKVLFEGSQEQIDNLLKLVKDGKDLPIATNHFYLDNLWQVADVQGNYKCDDSEALAVLDGALNSDSVMNDIWETIDYYAEENGLEGI